MKLGKHAVKVLTVFAVLFVAGFALKFLNLHEGFKLIGFPFKRTKELTKELTKTKKKLKKQSK